MSCSRDFRTFSNTAVTFPYLYANLCAGWLSYYHPFTEAVDMGSCIFEILNTD